MITDRPVYIEKIRPFIDKDLVKVLTGLRRSGKSVMLKLIQKELEKNGVRPEQCIQYNFESFQTESLRTAHALYEDTRNRMKDIQGKAYLFFDEIQEVADWEKCINALRVDCDCDIYLTGSNARLLSGELATYLAGRYVQIQILPYSFQEYVSSRKSKGLFTTEEQAFRDYVLTGGMPALTEFSENQPAVLQYLQDIYSTIVLKDIISRNKIRDVDLLERIIRYVMANIGRTFSANSLSRYFKNENRKVSVETILHYLKLCEEAFLIQRIQREDLSGKKILSVNEKFYLTDHGLRQAVHGHNEQDLELILENMVCLELIRQGYRVTVGRYGTKEIDFIAVKQDQTVYIQVCYLLASTETMEREFSVLERIADNYPKYVLSLDAFDFSRNGIRHMNLLRFLLDPGCLE